MLTRDSILASSPKFEPFEAFGGQCSIRVLTGRERDKVTQLSKQADAKNDYTGYRESLVVLMLGDASGARMFKDEDAVCLADKDSLELEKIVVAGLKLNELISKEPDAAKKS